MAETSPAMTARSPPSGRAFGAPRNDEEPHSTPLMMRMSRTAASPSTRSASW
jgi:hypothetical protein